MNVVTLVGRLGQDPELKETTNGKHMLRIRMATNEVYFDRNKEKQTRTDWHTVVVWDKRAVALERLLSKGDRIGVFGRLQTREWETKEGQKRYTTEVVSRDVELLSPPKGSSGAAEDDDAFDFPSPEEA